MPPEPGTWVDWQHMPYVTAECRCWDSHSDRVDQYRRPLALPYGTWRYAGPSACPVHGEEVTHVA